MYPVPQMAAMKKLDSHESGVLTEKVYSCKNVVNAQPNPVHKTKYINISTHALRTACGEPTLISCYEVGLLL